ncbi:DsbA family oxidoreductase [Vagococcus sp. BWB3-3]|uniref:DsbA family oxidoreductase n=1 Tax=Vagococcus allomyrinae TaxID=2794353 RepID=A0A940SX60_9ENTE|nr:DsbA family oxidoreductase [Vagococcus allomyrinae]MBP1043980.1 DsbA family oxidoreductase [Vagococcus allomyrinae]
MKIDIWSDFACPFCYIGKRHLETALNGREDVEVVFHSFELDPQAATHYEEDIHQLIANKYGISYEQSKANNDQVKQMAAATGLTYDFDAMQPTNTFTAHRLAQFAKDQGKGNEFVEAGMAAYFAKGAFLNDEETLVTIGTSVGLDESELRRIINSTDYLAPVRVDQTKAMELGIQSVPFFLIDDQYAISGAQPVATFENVLKQVPTVRQPSKGLNCEDGSCSI